MGFDIFKRKASKQQPSNNQSISNSRISDASIQISNAGENISQVQQGSLSTESHQTLSLEEVIHLFQVIESSIKSANLADIDKRTLADYLGTASKEVQQSNPNKDVITQRLKRISSLFSSINETSDEGETLWKTVKPKLLSIAGYLGIAKSLIGL